MRNVVFAINVSLDGCCDHTKFYPNEDVMEYFIQLTRDADTFLYGRKTYDLMVPYWPDAAKDPSGDDREVDYQFAKAFDAVGKIVVFSKSLEASENGKTKIVNSDIEGEVLKLKQEQGKNISTGGVEFASQLAKLNLIDEYHFIVHPIIVGEGRHAFDGANLPKNLGLKLVETKIFDSGAIVLQYLKQ